MIDIKKFICSLLADHPVGVTVREDIHKALKDQGLEYKGGKIVPIEDKTALKESEDERIRKWLIEIVEEVRKANPTNAEYNGMCSEAIAWLGKQHNKEGLWVSIDEHPLEQFTEVLAFNKAWINEDKCPNGVRIGFLGEDGFISATWNMEQDCYDTVYEQGDDYYQGNIFVIEEEKKKALPNMPTHYMLIPKPNNI